jgi:hypothetical protein
MNWFNALLYGFAGTAFLFSYLKDKQKTRMAVRKAFKSLENILPAMLVILMVIGVTMAWISPEVISCADWRKLGVFRSHDCLHIGLHHLDPRIHCFSLSRKPVET